MEKNRDTKRQQDMVARIASSGHESWRSGRRQEGGKFEPCIKILAKTDYGEENWYNDCEVPPNATELIRQDIANTEFGDLHPDWQEDNLLMAQTSLAACREYFDAHPGLLELLRINPNTPL